MTESVRRTASEMSRRRFLGRASLFALAAVASLIRAPSALAGVRRAGIHGQQSCGQFCAPAGNCQSGGCPPAWGRFHCVGCGQDYYQCFQRSCGSGFCLLPTC